MTRHHLSPLSDRVLRALRAGDMTPPELDRRLGTTFADQVLRRLEAQGRVQCVRPVHGNDASVWRLAR